MVNAKFRGIRKDNNEYVYGNLVQKTHDYIVNADGEYEVFSHSCDQYAGKDKNGKDLYDGDIIIAEDGTEATVCIGFYPSIVVCNDFDIFSTDHWKKDER